ncbi:hypothetical protein VA596_10895 [Amycolatopsis sp., V23-08]|uniref:SseB family protein n=1 Tax=Amycolatopsis heterodermiae TaxID=3110235 RepID=A0ABU5R2I2_9PSEU|nr:hypothetical protein [Amycolatopsis sp., V23-08]MEA5360044.1 hypothetical protein [Amycolatopsis sp., V23-08]
MNATLAAVLDREERDGQQILAALVDHGVFVPVDANGSVVFLKGEDGDPVLPGYVSEACRAELLPSADGAVRCDALRLLDIARDTGVEVLALFSTGGWARVPAALLRQTLQERGQQAAGDQLKLGWSRHPAAVVLRDGAVQRIREFPAVRTVWVSHARRLATGAEHLMVHIAVDEDLPSASADRLMKALLADARQDVPVGMLALNTKTHAETIAELGTMGLDTVLADHTTGRVEVLSREYDPG